MAKSANRFMKTTAISIVAVASLISAPAVLSRDKCLKDCPGLAPGRPPQTGLAAAFLKIDGIDGEASRRAFPKIEAPLSDAGWPGATPAVFLKIE